MNRLSKPSTKSLFARATTLLAVALPALLAGCVTNQATGRYQLDVYSKAAEVQLGEEVALQLKDQLGEPIADTTIRNYVSTIGNRVAVHVEEFYQDIPWEFNVINDSTINAFALPGGKIYIHRGLLEILDNEAQLAGILAHEVAHVTAEHHDRMAGRSMAIAIGTSVAQILTQNSESDLIRMGVPVFVTGSGLLNLRYSRAQEFEADDLGLRYMVRAGYQPTTLAEVMQKLDDITSGQRPSEWFSTHPSPPNRIAAIEAAIAERYPDAPTNSSLRRNAAQYKQSILDRLQ